MTLSRLVVDFRTGELVVRCLYRSGAQASEAPNPGTVARRREVVQLTRTGLERALRALEEGPVESLGTSGYEVREDTLGLATTSRVAMTSPKQVKAKLKGA